jgi:hypothetical protein
MEITKLNKESTEQTNEEVLNHTVTHVESLLKELNVDYVSFDDGAFTVTRGSAAIMIVVRSFTDQESCVEVVSNVVSEATLNEEVMQFLLRKNAELHFGGFGLLFDGTIVFTYAMPGSNLDLNELETAINAVTIIADHYDDEIVAMAGGRRATDINNEEFDLDSF